MKVQMDKKAEILLQIRYSSGSGDHKENFFFELNLWRECDILPDWFLTEILGKEEGEKFEFSIKGSEFFGFDQENILKVDKSSFKPPKFERVIEPRIGRFYPLGFFPGVRGAFPQNIKPVRVAGITEDHLELDLNSPSSYFDFDCEIEILKVREKKVELGGTCRDLFEEAFDGIGMQVRYKGVPTDFEFENKEAFSRLDESDDTIFYKEPRLTSHIDSKCHENLVKAYSEILPKRGKVLDFMSGYQSHFDGDYEVVGLGLNAEEMKLNPRLNDFVIQDINKNPFLPFEDREFDAIVCDFSIGYVVNPITIFKELERILKNGGVLAFSFSNRLFPQKAVRIWREISEYEKLGYVLELFLRNGWSKIFTITYRGYPRPWEDRYSLTQKFSDPLYIAYGIKG